MTSNIFDKVDLREKLSLFDELWSPKVVGELNGQLVKLAKLKGEFIWHNHKDEDELFLILKGSLTIKLRERDVKLSEGQFFIIPRGVEHLPFADEECHVLLFEPMSVLNTGDKVTEKTLETLDRI
ncbi:MAG: cupin domain-containing protein [Deltaproteobacteria bacterium]|nr:MAG: cupin domain-containing protein [Deltaproteobacteria bacterium]